MSALDKIRARLKERRLLDEDDRAALALLLVTIGIALSDGTISADEEQEIRNAARNFHNARKPPGS